MIAKTKIIIKIICGILLILIGTILIPTPIITGIPFIIAGLLLLGNKRSIALYRLFKKKWAAWRKKRTGEQ
jgi:hypothetical protein